MPRRIKPPEDIPLVKAGRSRRRIMPFDSLALSAPLEEWASISLTAAQEREVLEELCLTSAEDERAAMNAIFPILYEFDQAQRLAQVRPSAREETAKADRAISALARATKALQALGPDAANAVQATHHQPDYLEELTGVLSEAKTSLVLFIRDFPIKPGARGNRDVENAMGRLAEIYLRWRGRPPGINGPFERFCLKTLRIMDKRVTASAIKTLVRKLVGERRKALRK